MCNLHSICCSSFLAVGIRFLFKNLFIFAESLQFHCKLNDNIRTNGLRLLFLLFFFSIGNLKEETLDEEHRIMQLRIHFKPFLFFRLDLPQNHQQSSIAVIRIKYFFFHATELIDIHSQRGLTITID